MLYKEIEIPWAIMAAFISGAIPPLFKAAFVSESSTIAPNKEQSGTTLRGMLTNPKMVFFIHIKTYQEKTEKRKQSTPQNDKNSNFTHSKSIYQRPTHIILPKTTIIILSKLIFCDTILCKGSSQKPSIPNKALHHAPSSSDNKPFDRGRIQATFSTTAAYMRVLRSSSLAFLYP